MMNGFCFIIEGLNVKGKTPLELIPGHFFRRANTKEIGEIKEYISKYGIYTAPYEATRAKRVSTSGYQYTYDLPKSKWRYWLISFEGTNDKIREIEYAANLLKHDINIAFTFVRDETLQKYGIMYTPSILYTLISDTTRIPEVLSVDTDELLEIGNNYNLISDLDKDSYRNIFRAIQDFYFTKNISKISSLLVVAYFSIIECIIIHKPKPEDTIDSISRQIKTKMYLLSKRFQRDIDYKAYFGKAKFETIWGKLYSYRSSIAHGDDIKFNGEFKILKNKDNVHEFLKETIKLLLLYAITNPDFILDFREC